jgi:hypothetical protein
MAARCKGIMHNGARGDFAFENLTAGQNRQNGDDYAGENFF